MQSSKNQRGGYNKKTEQQQQKKGGKSSNSSSSKNPNSKPAASQQYNTNTQINNSNNPGSEYEPSGTFEMGKYKTKLCRHWKTGYCLFGPSCVFAHGVDDLCEPNLLISQMSNLVLVPMNMNMNMSPYGTPMPVGYNEAGMNPSLQSSPGNQMSNPNQLPIQMSVPLMQYTMPMMPLTSQSLPHREQLNAPMATPLTMGSNSYYSSQSQQQQLQLQQQQQLLPIQLHSNSLQQTQQGGTIPRKEPAELCVICLDVLDNSRPKAFLPCMHEFHEICIQKSEKNLFSVGCPLCSTPHPEASSSSPSLSSSQTSQNQPPEVPAE